MLHLENIEKEQKSRSKKLTIIITKAVQPIKNKNGLFIHTKKANKKKNISHIFQISFFSIGFFFF